MHATLPEKAVKSVFAIQNVVGDRTMKQSYHQSQYQAREVGHHVWSLASTAPASIGRKT